MLDFGIAKLHGGTSGTGLTHTGATMGTPFYMSLEQARGAKEVDHRTDIYALGVILYEILSGAKPHPGESYNEILYHVISNEPAPLDAVRDGLPAGLATAAHKAMAREPSDRYDSVADLMEALIPFAGRAVTPLQTSLGATVPTPKSLPGIPVSKTAKLESPESPVAGLSPETPEIPDDIPARSHSRLFLFGGLAALGVLLVAVVMWFGFARKPHPEVAPLTPVVVPPALPPPTAVSPPAEKVESPPASPPGRPVGQRQAKRPAATVVDARPAKIMAPAEQPAESQKIPATPRRKLVRSIDRQNPFAE